MAKGEREGLENIISQMENVAQQAWENHPSSQPVNSIRQRLSCLLVEKLAQLLIEHPSPVSQILDGVYMDRQEYPGHKDIKTPRVGVLILGQAVNRFIKTGGVDYIAFETHPEWVLLKEANLRWLVIRGSHPENSLRKLWETEYTFDGSKIRKQEKEFCEGRWEAKQAYLSLDQSDLDVINGLIKGIRDQVGGRLLTRSV